MGKEGRGVVWVHSNTFVVVEDIQANRPKVLAST